MDDVKLFMRMKQKHSEINTQSKRCLKFQTPLSSIHRKHGGPNNRRTINVVVLLIRQSPIEIFQLLLVCVCVNEGKKCEKFARLFDTEIVFLFRCLHFILCAEHTQNSIFVGFRLFCRIKNVRDIHSVAIAIDLEAKRIMNQTNFQNTEFERVQSQKMCIFNETQ